MGSQAIEAHRAGAEVYRGAALCAEKSTQLLSEAGLPLGLLPLPAMEEVGYNRATGFVWLRQKRALVHAFKRIGRQVSYAAEVTAFVEDRRMTRMTGVKTKELLVWVALSDMCVDRDDPSRITFRTPSGLGRTFPVAAFAKEDKATPRHTTRAPQPPSTAQKRHGDGACPPRRRGAAGRRRGRAADVRAHRVPGVRGRGRRQRLRDPALHRRRVGVHRARRRHLLRRRHARRLPPAVRLHPGEERGQRDDRDDGAGADGGVAQRRPPVRLLLRGQLLRAPEEPGGPAAGRGPARAALAGGQVRGRAPLRRLRGRRGRRRAGRAARRQPAGHQVGRRGRPRAPGGPRVRLRRGAVQLAVRVQRQGQRGMDALRRRRRGTRRARAVTKIKCFPPFSRRQFKKRRPSSSKHDE